MARLIHGTINAYSNHGCRCERCGPAGRQYWATWRAAKAKTLAANDPRHGTNNGYCNYGCRCRECTDAHAKAQRASRRRAAAKLWLG